MKWEGTDSYVRSRVKGCCIAYTYSELLRPLHGTYKVPNHISPFLETGKQALLPHRSLSSRPLHGGWQKQDVKTSTKQVTKWSYGQCGSLQADNFFVVWAVPR